MAPQTQKQWIITGENGFDSLEKKEGVPLEKIGDNDVLVKIHAASLNYRDLVIPKGLYPFPKKDNVVPGSDGAGTVEAVGANVTRFKKGDRVATLFNQAHLFGDLDPHSVATGLGGAIDGVLRQYGVFDESGLVEVPKHLNWQEASTLSCAALTAWNGLYGLQSRALKAGDTVLTQGTGGVSVFALQFAKAAGATVISTTSSDAKAKKLKELGADHVLNYKTDPNWGETAKKLTPGGLGVTHVIEVGGPGTLRQSIKAVKYEGVISVIGFVAGGDQPPLLEVLSNICTVRGIFVGSRAQMEDMNKAILANNIHPVVDPKVFSLDELKEAYQYQWDQKHFGKLTIKID